MTIPAPRDPFSEVVDKNRRWTPEWYSWLQQFTLSAGGIGISGVPVAGQLAQWVNASTLQGLTSPYAPIASPTFTGDPKAPTPAAGDNDTSIATTAFVRSSIVAAETYLNFVTDCGGVGDGTTDNSGAFTTAITAIGSRGGTIFFPRGSYKFASLQTVSMVLNALYDLTLLGEGSDATWLLWPAAVDGLKINFNSNTSLAAQSFHMRDISVISADSTPSQIGVFLNQSGSLNGAYTAYSEFTRVNFMGSDGPVGSNGWGICVKCADVSNVQFTGCSMFGTGAVAGTGVSWEGTNSSNFATGLYFNDCAINQFTNGILMLDFVQGMYLTACQVNGCTVGVNLTGGSSNLDSAVSIVNSEFGVYATNSNAITMTNAVAFLQIDSSNFNMAQVTGPAGYIILATTKHVQITNCSMVAPGWPGGVSTVGTKLTGISLAGTAATTATLIANNIIAGFFGNGSGVNASVPLIIQATAHDILVTGNCFVSNQFVGATQSCVNNAGGVKVIFDNNFYDNGFGPPTTTGFTGDAATIKGNQTSTILGNINNAFGVNLGNQNNTAGDHGIVIFGGASTTSDTSTVFIDFLDPSANLCGSITRNDTGSVRGLSFNGNSLLISGGITASTITASLSGTFMATIGNTHNAVGDHGIILQAGNNASTTDTSTVFVNLVTPNNTQCGAIVRADAAGTRTVNYNQTSDIRLKSNVRETVRGLSDLLKLRVIDYGPDGDRAQGLAAQDVFQVYPEAVTPGGDDPQKAPWMMGYGRITPLLVQAIKDLSLKVERLEAELARR